MNAVSRPIADPIRAARAVAWAAMIGLGVLPASAAQIALPFTVAVHAAGNAPATAGLCRSNNRIGTFGQSITILCSSGEPVDFRGNTTGLPWAAMQDGSFRFVNLVSWSGEPMGTVDSYAGPGTVTSWRVITIAGRDYLELLVGW